MKIRIEILNDGYRGMIVAKHSRVGCVEDTEYHHVPATDEPRQTNSQVLELDLGDSDMERAVIMDQADAFLRKALGTPPDWERKLIQLDKDFERVKADCQSAQEEEKKAQSEYWEKDRDLNQLRRMARELDGLLKGKPMGRGSKKIRELLEELTAR